MSSITHELATYVPGDIRRTVQAPAPRMVHLNFPLGLVSIWLISAGLFLFTVLLSGTTVTATITNKVAISGFDDGNAYIFHYRYNFAGKTYCGSGYTTEERYKKRGVGDEVSIKLIPAVPCFEQQLKDESEPWVTAAYLLCFGLVWLFLAVRSSGNEPSSIRPKILQGPPK